MEDFEAVCSSLRPANLFNASTFLPFPFLNGKSASNLENIFGLFRKVVRLSSGKLGREVRVLGLLLNRPKGCQNLC